jgi:hypothetical protein
MQCSTMFKFSAQDLANSINHPNNICKPWIVQRWSSWKSVPIFSKFSVILCVLGHLERLSSSAETRPA